jgi:hypothetical protein
MAGKRLREDKFHCPKFTKSCPECHPHSLQEGGISKEKAGDFAITRLPV